MEKLPGYFEEIQQVAILRCLKKSQDEVIAILAIAKDRVVDIEKWLKTEKIEEIEGLFVDYRLKKVIKARLLKKLDPLELIAAWELTGEEIMLHYRPNYPPKRTESVAYELRQSAEYRDHQQKLLDLVNKIGIGLDLRFEEYQLRELGRKGTHSASVSSFSVGDRTLSWEVQEKGPVVVKAAWEIESDAATKILYCYLLQHLRSSNHLCLLEGDQSSFGSWKSLAGQELENRIKLLVSIDRAVKKLTQKAPLESGNLDFPGPSMWFSNSIMAIAVDKRYANLTYKIEEIDSGLIKVQYGAALIGMVKTRVEGENYIKWHKHLCQKFSRSKAAKTIANDREKRGSVAKKILSYLDKFKVDGYIPGQCGHEYCAPGKTTH